MDAAKSLLDERGKKLLLPCLLLVGLLLVAFGNWSGGSGKVREATAEVWQATEQEYLYDLQDRLEAVLSQISGAGEVSVMLTLAGGAQNVLATDEKINENVNGENKTTSRDSKVVTTKDKPLVLQELKPKIEGVVVVSAGANNPHISMQLNQAVVALTGVKTHKVVVLPKK